MADGWRLTANQMLDARHWMLDKKTAKSEGSKKPPDALRFTDLTRIFHQDEHSVGLFPANTLI